MSAIGKIQVDLVANMGPFTANMQKAGVALGQFAKSFVGIGNNFKAFGGVVSRTISTVVNLKTALTGAAVAFGAFRIASSLDAAADTVDKLGKVSKRLGVTVEQLSALRFAAGESGIEFEKLATMASKAAKGVAEIVADGNTTVKVGRLTVKLTDAAGQVRNIADLLPDLARGIESAGSEAEQLRLAQRFFGKGGGDDFVTLLKESGTFVKGLAEQTERARRLGVLFTEDQVEKLTAYRDAVGRVQQAWLGVKVKLMTEIAPAVTEFLDGLALRIAGLPDLIKATIRAFNLLGSGSPEQKRAAAEMLANLRNATVDLLKTTAVETGRLLGTALVESLRYGLRALAPEISDLFRDVLGPILNAIPGVKIEKSTRGKLAELREQLAAVTSPAASATLAAAVRDLAALNAAGPMAGVGMGMGGGSDPRGRLQNEINRLSRDAERLRNSIAVQEAMVKQEDVDRMKALGQATADYATSLADAGAVLAARVVPGVEAVDKAASAIAEAMKEPEFVGPPAPAPQKFPDIFRAYDDLVEGAKETGRRIGAGLAKGWEVFKEAAKKAYEHSEAVLKDAQEIRFSIYPQEKMEAEIEHVNAVRRALIKLGLESKLTEEDVQKAIAKIRESYKEAPKEVKNLAEDMADAIRSFAGDAGQAFADFAFDARASLGDLLKSWGKTLFAMATQAMIFKPLFDGLASWFGGTSLGKFFSGVSTAPAGSPGANVPSHAMGGSVSGGSWSWVGERGPELVQFGRSGYVYPNGVMPSGGGVMVQIVDQRGSGARPEVSENRGPDGRKMIRVLIRDEVKGMVSDGSLDRTMASAYGVSRRGTSR